MPFPLSVYACLYVSTRANVHVCLCACAPFPQCVRQLLSRPSCAEGMMSDEDLGPPPDEFQPSHWRPALGALPAKCPRGRAIGWDQDLSDMAWLCLINHTLS